MFFYLKVCGFCVMTGFSLNRILLQKQYRFASYQSSTSQRLQILYIGVLHVRVSMNPWLCKSQQGQFLISNFLVLFRHGQLAASRIILALAPGHPCQQQLRDVCLSSITQHGHAHHWSNFVPLKCCCFNGSRGSTALLLMESQPAGFSAPLQSRTLVQWAERREEKEGLVGSDQRVGVDEKQTCPALSPNTVTEK